MAKRDNEWYRMKTSDNDIQRMVQRMTKSDNEWQRMTTNDSGW